MVKLLYISDDHLNSNNIGFYFDYQNGTYGYNTSSERGADTFSPFKTTHTDTYTFPSNDTGGTKDLGITHVYRYVNAANVYAKGKADAGISVTIVTKSMMISGWDSGNYNTITNVGSGYHSIAMYSCSINNSYQGTVNTISITSYNSSNGTVGINYQIKKSDGSGQHGNNATVSITFKCYKKS